MAEGSGRSIRQPGLWKQKSNKTDEMNGRHTAELGGRGRRPAAAAPTPANQECCASVAAPRQTQH